MNVINKALIRHVDFVQLSMDVYPTKVVYVQRLNDISLNLLIRLCIYIQLDYIYTYMPAKSVFQVCLSP